MSVQKCTMEFGGNEIYPVTDSEVVKYGNTTVKNALDALPTASSFMDSLLACTDANQVRKVLHISADPFYDECGNKWAATGAPAINDGALILNGSSYLQCITPGWTLGQDSDFTVEVIFKLNSLTNNRCVFAAHVNNAAPAFLAIAISGKLSWWYRLNSSTKYQKDDADSLVVGTVYKCAWTFDSTNKTCSLYKNGSKVVNNESMNVVSTFTSFNIGAAFTKGDNPDGEFYEIRVSKVNRYPSSCSMPDRLTYDSDCLALLHFD